MLMTAKSRQQIKNENLIKINGDRCIAKAMRRTPSSRVSTRKLNNLCICYHAHYLEFIMVCNVMVARYIRTISEKSHKKYSEICVVCLCSDFAQDAYECWKNGSETIRNLSTNLWKFIRLEETARSCKHSAYILISNRYSTVVLEVGKKWMQCAFYGMQNAPKSI